jgi:endonuclease/exonuclease/phosphatase (EEP) superfamily protein YafD
LAANQRISARSGERGGVFERHEDAEDVALERPKRKRNPRRGRVWCTFIILAGLAGLAAGQLAKLWVHFDVFNQFSAQFAIFLIAGSIGLLMPRGKALTALALTVAAVIALGLWPQISSREINKLSDIRPGEKAVRLMAFNTHAANHDLAAIEAEIYRNDPDLVVMVEFDHDKQVLLDRLKSRYPYIGECLALDYCYLAVASKFPITKAVPKINWDGPPTLQVSFGSELGHLTLLGVHTIRFPHSRAQFRQILELVKLLEPLGQNVVVAGDFNATPFSRTLQTFEERSALFRVSYLPSWPAQLHLPQLAIDHIFIGSQMRRLEATRLGHNAGSDHYPMISTFAVPIN